VYVLFWWIPEVVGVRVGGSSILGPSGTGLAGVGRTGRAGDGRADVPKPPADARRVILKAAHHGLCVIMVLWRDQMITQRPYPCPAARRTRSEMRIRLHSRG